MTISGVSSNSALQQAWLAKMQQRKQDFAQLGAALQSGDLATAQSAFADLQTLMPGGGAAQTSATTTTTGATDTSALAAASTTTSPAEVTDPGAMMQQAWQAKREERQQLFSQLGSALQSGNLADAQSAYASLQNLQPPGPPAPGDTTNAAGSSGNTMGNDLAALGQALNSGNLSDAQAAYAKMQTDMQAHRGGHHHHGGLGGGASASKEQAAASYAANSDGDPLSSLIDGLQTLLNQLQPGSSGQSGDSSATSLTQTAATAGSGQNPLQEQIATLQTLLQNLTSLSPNAAAGSASLVNTQA